MNNANQQPGPSKGHHKYQIEMIPEYIVGRKRKSATVIQYSSVYKLLCPMPGNNLNSFVSNTVHLALVK